MGDVGRGFGDAHKAVGEGQGKESLLGKHETCKWAAILPGNVLSRQLGGDQGRRHPCPATRGYQERTNCRGAENPDGEVENVNLDVQERQAHFKHEPRFLILGWRPKPILPHTKRRPNSKVAMSRRTSALEAFPM